MFSRTLVFALAVLHAGFAALACDPAPPASDLADQAPDPQPRTRAQRSAPAAQFGSGSAARRGRLIGGERVQRAPQWPPADELAQDVRARAPAALLEAIARSPVPVLVPGDPAWLARARLYVPEDPRAFGYAFAGSDGDGPEDARHLSVQASRIATLVPHIGRIRGDAVRSGEGSFSVNEGVRTASWIEHGVAYSLDLECFDPAAPTCDEATLRELVAGLVYVGGAAVDDIGGAQ